VRCIEMGPADYLPKPFDPVLLRARINGCLTAKRLRDFERRYLEQERERVRGLFARFVPKRWSTRSWRMLTRTSA
jgi:adenylate cyclase